MKALGNGCDKNIENIIHTMKLISSLLLAAALCTASAAARTTTTVMVDSVAVKSASDTDSVSQTVEMAEGESTVAPTVSKENGKWILTYDGSEYQITTLINSACDDYARTQSDEGFSPVFVPQSEPHSMVPVIVALVFGIPCIGVIAALIVISVVTLRKARNRQEIINKAIEFNYQLPDEFYNPHKPTDFKQGNSRDLRKFTGGVTLGAVGLALVILAIVNDNSFFLICGLIPLFLGIGKLIGYFLLPAQNCPPNNGYPSGPQTNYPPQPPYSTQQPCAPQQPYAPQQPFVPRQHYAPQQPGHPWNGNCMPGAQQQGDNTTPPPYQHQ